MGCARHGFELQAAPRSGVRARALQGEARGEHWLYGSGAEGQVMARMDEAASPNESARRLVLTQGALHEGGGAPARAARAVGVEMAAQLPRRGVGAEEAAALYRAAP